MKFISLRVHGIIDFVVVLFLLASPMSFGLSGLVAIFTYALAIVHLTLTLLTDFSAGLLKVISLPLHGMIELVVGIALIILGFTLFKNAGAGKVFYIAFGSAVLITWLFSDYQRNKYIQD